MLYHDMTKKITSDMTSQQIELIRKRNRKYQQEWWEKNRELQIKRVKRNTVLSSDRNSRFIFDYLISHSCVKCGEGDPLVLEFHHIANKKFHLSDYRDLSLSTIREEIEKCEVMCANCHRRQTHEQFNTRRYRLAIQYNAELA